MGDFEDFGSCHECGERGTHSSDCNVGWDGKNISSGSGISLIGAIVCQFIGLVLTALVFSVFGVDVSEVPTLLIVILWQGISIVLTGFISARL